MFKTTKGAFLRSLETAAKFTANRQTLPILKYLKIDGKNGKVHGTDLECEAICNFKCDHTQQVQVDEITIPDFRREDLAEITVKQLSELMGPESKGKKKDEIIEFILKFQAENPIKSESVIEISDEFMVDASLIKIVKALPMENEDEITIKIVGHPCTGYPLGITFNDIKEVFVNQVGVDEFPSAQAPKFPEFVCEINGKDVVHVAKACTTDKAEKRVHLTSLYFDCKKGTVCGCDGRRIHTKHIESCGENVLIPVEPMRKIASFATEKIMIGVSNGMSKVVVDGNIFIIMNNQGDYPDYETILKYESNDAEFDTKRLVESLKQAVSMVSGDFKGVTFDINDEGAKISYVNPERGELEIEGIPCSIGIGIKAQFAINPAYILDAISLNDEKSLWSISKEHGPVVVRHGEFQNVVMPMKV